MIGKELSGWLNGLFIRGHITEVIDEKSNNYIVTGIDGLKYRWYFNRRSPTCRCNKPIQAIV